jgi:general secretion pathway protein G
MTAAREAIPMIRSSSGFTLIEILVVVLIIGLLSAVLATNLIGRADDAKVQLAATQIRNLEQSLELYKLDNGRYPTVEQGLKALVREPIAEPRPRRYPAGGYVKREALVDPWGLPYEYEIPGEWNSHSFDLSSFGADGLEGGEGNNADITNWETEPL